MKRKHGALIFDPSRVNSVPSVPFAHSKTGQYLQGQDLATESVLLAKSASLPAHSAQVLTPVLPYRVKHLGSKGWGLITKQPVKQGSLVLEYVGEPCLLASVAVTIHAMHRVACCAKRHCMSALQLVKACMCTGDLISKAEARQRIEEYEKDEIDSLYLLHLRYISSLPHIYPISGCKLALPCSAISAVQAASSMLHAKVTRHATLGTQLMLTVSPRNGLSPTTSYEPS